MGTNWYGLCYPRRILELALEMCSTPAVPSNVGAGTVAVIFGVGDRVLLFRRQMTHPVHEILFDVYVSDRDYYADNPETGVLTRTVNRQEALEVVEHAGNAGKFIQEILLVPMWAPEKQGYATLFYDHLGECRDPTAQHIQLSRARLQNAMRGYLKSGEHDRLAQLMVEMHDADARSLPLARDTEEGRRNRSVVGRMGMQGRAYVDEERIMQYLRVRADRQTRRERSAQSDMRASALVSNQGADLGRDTAEGRANRSAVKDMGMEDAETADSGRIQAYLRARAARVKPPAQVMGDDQVAKVMVDRYDADVENLPLDVGTRAGMQNRYSVRNMGLQSALTADEGLIVAYLRARGERTNQMSQVERARWLFGEYGRGNLQVGNIRTMVKGMGMPNAAEADTEWVLVFLRTLANASENPRKRMRV